MIAITGANGFVGRTLVRDLLRDRVPGDIRPLVRDERRARVELGRDDLPLRVVDVCDPESLRGALDGCTALVHTVAIPTERRQRFADVNVRGVQNTIAEAERAGVRRIVHISAIGADPASPLPYLRSKGEGQRIVEASGIDYVVLRPSLLFGPGDDFFPRLAFSLKFPLVPVPGDGKARFQPLHVEDLVRCLRAALSRDDLRGAYEVGGAEVVTYDELLAETMTALGIRRPLVHVPVPLVKPGAVAMGLVMADPPVTTGQLDLLAVDNVPRPNEIERFGVAPRSLRGGLNYLQPRGAA